MTVELGPRTEELAALPLELLHDEQGYIFAHPNYTLVRLLMETTAVDFALPARPRLLFAGVPRADAVQPRRAPE